MIFGRLESAYVESRYKLLTVADRRFILDLDSHPLFPLFPFLVLIIPVKAIEIDDRDIIYTGPTSMSKFLMLLISISIKTLSKLLKNYSLSNLNSVEKRLFILATVVLILTVRYYFKMKKERIPGINIINQMSIRIRPNELFASFRMIVGFLIFGSIDILIVYLNWMDMNLFLLLLRTLLFKKEERIIKYER